MISTCPSKVELINFSFAQLEPALAQAIADHLDGCAECDQRLEELESEQIGRFSKWNPSPEEEELASDRVSIRTQAAEGLAGLQVGDRCGDCRLIAELGAGAFGRVFLAEHLSMKRFVALKISTRKSQEPELLASLDHPHIVRVLHFDDQLSNEGLYLLFMRYVPGCTLRQILNALRVYPQERWNGALLLQLVRQQHAQHGASYIPASEAEIADLDWPSTVAWMGARISHALHYAHQKGILHRDIKPENILLDFDGHPYLIDFNVSVGSSNNIESPEEAFGGSLPYMAPEQLSVLATGEGIERVGPSADVYGLGIVLWEQLCGQRPFHETTWHGATTQLIARKVELTASNLRPPVLARELPRGLATLLQNCLTIDPEKRPSCEYLYLQLHLFSLASLRPILLPKIPRWRSRIFMSLLYLLAGELSILLFTVLSVEHQLNATFGPIHGEGIPGLMRTTTLVVTASHMMGTIFLIAYLGRPLRSILRIRLEFDRRVPREISAKCLGAGLYISVIVFLLWCFSAAVLLTVHDSIFANVRLTPEFAIRFLVPHLTYGLISSITVGLFTTYVSIRVLYPPLVPHCDHAHARGQARMVRWFLQICLSILVMVPNLGLMLLVGYSQLDLRTGMTIGIVGTAGFSMALVANGRILSRLAEIDRVFAPFITM